MTSDRQTDRLLFQKCSLTVQGENLDLFFSMLTSIRFLPILCMYTNAHTVLSKAGANAAGVTFAFGHALHVCTLAHKAVLLKHTREERGWDQTSSAPSPQTVAHVTSIGLLGNSATPQHFIFLCLALIHTHIHAFAPSARHGFIKQLLCSCADPSFCILN